MANQYNIFHSEDELLEFIPFFCNSLKKNRKIRVKMTQRNYGYYLLVA